MHTHSIDKPGLPLSPPRSNDATPRAASPRKMPEMLSRELRQLNDDIGPHGTLMTPVFQANGVVARLLARIPMECGERQQQAALEMADLCRLVSSQLTQAEQAYEISEHEMGLKCLAAAKTNQVRLLGQIDRLDGPPGGEMQFTNAHHLCVELGDRISTIFLHTRDKADGRADNTSRNAGQPGSRPLFQSPKKTGRKDAAKLDKTPLHQRSDLQGRQSGTPSPARQSMPSSTSEYASPPRQKKRAQGSDVSPTMESSPSKRHRSDSGQAVPGASSPARHEAAALPATGSAAHCTSPSGKITSPTVPSLDWTKAKPRGESPRSPSRTTPRPVHTPEADALPGGARRHDATASVASSLGADALPEDSSIAGERRTAAHAPLSPPARLSPPVSPRARVGSPHSPLDRLRPMSPSRTFTIKGKVRSSVQTPRTREHEEQGSGEGKAETTSMNGGAAAVTSVTNATTTGIKATTTATATSSATDAPAMGAES